VNGGVDLIERWIAAFNARDERGLLACAHPEIVLRPLRWGVRAEYHGHAGVRDWLATISANPSVSTITAQYIEPLLDGGIAEGVVDADGTRFVAVYRLRDGLIADVRAYMSDRATLERLGLIAPE
jgi:hypothetical protein